MSGLNLDVVKEAQDELNKGGGGGFFIRLGKEERTKDIRILEPTPSMNGRFWVEATQWWINNKPLVVDQDSTLVDDILKSFEEEFGNTADGKAEWKALRYATKGKGQDTISKSRILWLPVLELEWDIDPKTNAIIGIETDGEYDVEKIKNYVKGPKVLDCKVTLLNSIINQITTGRDGKFFLDQEKGYNLTIQRQGDGTKTAYSATKQEQMPMPPEFYGTGALDMVETLKANLHSEAYVEKVLANYFFGEDLPEEAEFMFPEIRAKFKKNDEQEEEKPRTRSRTRAKLQETQAEETTPVRRGRAVKEETTEEAPRTRRRRDLVSDVASANNESDE
jgi:hypothetical protein